MTSANTTPRRSWRSGAACRDVDPELFFPVGESGAVHDRQVGEAKAVCGGCPVRLECLDEALARIPEGIAGGLTAAERRRFSRRRPAQPVAGDELARVARTRRQVSQAGSVLLAAGRSTQAVARECGVSERTVYRWRAAATSTGRVAS